MANMAFERDAPKAARPSTLRYVSYRGLRMIPFHSIGLAVLAALIALALPPSPAIAAPSSPASIINADVLAKNLPLTDQDATRSGDGRRKQRWRIRGVELSSFEVIGNTQTDADLIGWNCVEYDGKGNSASPIRNGSLCRRFFVSVMKLFVADPEPLVQDLLLLSVKTRPTSAKRMLGDLLIETDGEFFFIRRRSRM